MYFQSGEGSEGIPGKLLKALKNLNLCSKTVSLPSMSMFYFIVTLPSFSVVLKDLGFQYIGGAQ